MRMREMLLPLSMEAFNYYFHAITNLTRFFYALRFVDASNEPL